MRYTQLNSSLISLVVWGLNMIKYSMLLELLYFSFSIRHFQLWWRFCCCDVTCFFNVLLLSFYCYRLYVNCVNHFDKKNMDIYSKFFPSCLRIYSEFTLAKTLKHLQYTTSKTLFHQQSGRLLKKVPNGLSHTDSSLDLCDRSLELYDVLFCHWVRQTNKSFIQFSIVNSVSNETIIPISQTFNRN